MDAKYGVRIRRDIRLSADVLPCGEDLVNWLVDALVQANVDLRSVSADDLKDLLTYASRIRHLRSLCRPGRLLAS